jgi:hypothetical protein
VLVKSRELSKKPNTAVVAGGRRDKDDRKQNTLAPLMNSVKYNIIAKTLQFTQLKGREMSAYMK